MTSQVAICNRALSKIGETPITSLEDDVPSAKLLKGLFDDTRDMLLRSYPWRFALKEYSLAPLTEKPRFSKGNAFQLPTDCLRVWRPEIEWIRYNVAGKTIIAAVEVFNFIGISRITDVTMFDASFVDALAVKLAEEASFSLTDTPALKQILAQEFRETVQNARTTSAMEGAQDALYPVGWLEARR